jgi:hypothetical protein
MAKNERKKLDSRQNIAAGPVQGWLAIRRAGSQIDPETAEVITRYVDPFDPYCMNPRAGKQLRQEFFACTSGTDEWVWFGDLPDNIRAALLGKTRESGQLPPTQ